MSNYTQHGSKFLVGKAADSVVHKKLPPATYTVGFSDQVGYFLEQITNFQIPSKIYGNAVKQAERILSTFKSRPAATGVHLDGVKGSGKTLLVKVLATSARLEHDIPTIVINHPFHGDAFNSFIQAIECDAIIIFDEFEKTYDWGDQKKILTLFDGVYPSRKLFVLTTNNTRECSDYLKNRPGRMYYSLEYDVLEEEIIREVLDDMLEDKSKIPSVVKYAQVFTFLNFDMLVAIIQEMNRYGESLEEVLKMLNVQPEMRRDDKFNIELVVNSQTPYHIGTVNAYDPNTWYEHFKGNDIIEASKPVTQRANYEDEMDSITIQTMLSGTDAEVEQEIAKSKKGKKKLKKLKKYQPIETQAVANGMSEHGADEYIRVGANDLHDFDGAKGVFTYKVVWRGSDVLVAVTRDVSDHNGGRSIFNAGAL